MTMLRRNIKHEIRRPAVGFGSAMMPILLLLLLLLLFVYAFGDSIGAGVDGGPGHICELPDARHHRHGRGRRLDIDLDSGLLRRPRASSTASAP